MSATQPIQVNLARCSSKAKERDCFIDAYVRLATRNSASPTEIERASRAAFIAWYQYVEQRAAPKNKAVIPAEG